MVNSISVNSQSIVDNTSTIEVKYNAIEHTSQPQSQLLHHSNPISLNHMESTSSITVKMSLKKFLTEKGGELHELIQLHVVLMNQIVTEGYHLLYFHSL